MARHKMRIRVRERDNADMARLVRLLAAQARNQQARERKQRQSGGEAW